MKPTKANFCSTVRDAITALGFSTVKALNVVNAALGQMTKTKTGDDKTKDVKVKIPKSDVQEPTASVSVTPGTETYQSKLNAALMFASWNDAVAHAEKLCPTMQIRLEPTSAFGQWLAKVAQPDKKDETSDKKDEKTEPAKA